MPPNSFYSTATLSGTTDADGTFTYFPSEVVSFYIGDILIGSAEGQDILTPLEFVPDAEDASHPEVTSILRFLQSLDEDGDPDNGITISQLTITQAASQDGVIRLITLSVVLATRAMLNSSAVTSPRCIRHERCTAVFQTVIAAMSPMRPN